MIFKLVKSELIVNKNCDINNLPHLFNVFNSLRYYSFVGILLLQMKLINHLLDKYYLN